MKRWLKTRQCSTAVCTVRVYVNPVSVCGRILNTAGAFLEKLKFTARPRHVVIGREVGVSRCGLRSPLTPRSLLIVSEQRNVRRRTRRTRRYFSAPGPPYIALQRSPSVVFHYAAWNIYCQVVGGCP